MAKLDQKTKYAVHRFLEIIEDQYDISRVLLYGSRARQTHRPDSDADVAILLHGKPKRFLPTKLEMADVAYEVFLETGIRIQPLPIWEQEWKHPKQYSNPELLENIAKEGVPVGPSP